jgi:napC/nirT cytochrome c family protein
MVIAYQDDIHSGKGKTGIKAQCVDCHLPHDNIVKYVYQKAKNGVFNTSHFFRKKISHFLPLSEK